jgi:membrane associated rhomboid family serine protease
MFPIRNAVPTRYPPLVTWMLIGANCAVFLFQLGLSPTELEEFLADFALIPARYTNPSLFGETALSPADFIPFFTMMFLHGGWLHLILNMWTLWLFAPAIEDRLGHGRYLLFYLVCGIVSGIAHAMFNPGSTAPALGASGAIAGVLGCYILMFPLSRVVVVIPILFIPLFFELYAFVFIVVPDPAPAGRGRADDALGGRCRLVGACRRLRHWRPARPAAAAAGAALPVILRR